MKWGIKISQRRIPTSFLLHQGRPTPACAEALAAISKAQARAIQSCSTAALVVRVGRDQCPFPIS